MRIDKIRLNRYLSEIKRNNLELYQLVGQNDLKPNSIPLKAAKYILIELAEAMSNTIQHILAKEKGIAVSGYIDTVLKAYENGLITETLFQKLKPFFDFRNSLIHRYWIIDDTRLIENIIKGKNDFDQFIEEGLDFVSFGTNDLTQYTLAIDRNNENVAYLYDETHHAVLRLIEHVIKECNKAGVKTSICGQAGSSPSMAKKLVELGITSISANIDAVESVREAVLRAEKGMLLDVARRS